MKRPSILLLIIFAAGAVGWLSVEPAPEKPPAIRRDGPVDVPLVPRFTGVREPLGHNSGDLDALEKDLLRALNPDAGTFSGERLAELCLERRPMDLPGPDAAFTYARGWAMRDPQGMFAWFESRGAFFFPADGSNFGFMQTLFIEWARKAPDDAVAAALTCTKKRNRVEALTAIVESLFKTNPEQARAIAAKHIEEIGGNGLSSFSAYGSDYRQKWELLRALPAGKGRDQVLAKFFNEIIQYHGAEVEQMWRELPDTLRRSLVDGGFSGAPPGDLESGSGAPGALEGLGELLRENAEQTGDPRKWLNSGAAREWAAKEPAEAIAWAQTHLKGEARVTTVAKMFGAAAGRDFTTAVQQWQLLPEGILRARAAGHLAAGAPAAHEAEVSALLDSLSPSDQSLATAARLSEERARKQIENLLNLRERLRPQG